MKLRATERQSTDLKRDRPAVRRWFYSTVCALFLIGHASAHACPVCFGDPNSDMARGAKWGIIVLGIVIYGLLMGMVGVGVTWFVRARKLQDP